MIFFLAANSPVPIHDVDGNKRVVAGVANGLKLVVIRSFARDSRIGGQRSSKTVLRKDHRRLETRVTLNLAAEADVG